MKGKYILIAFFAMTLAAAKTHAQGIAVNTDGAIPNPNAILDVKSFNKGVLLPRLSTAGRLAIPNTKGLLVYDSTIGNFFYNTGSGWQTMAKVLQSAAAWSVNGNGATNANNFLGTSKGALPFVLQVNGLRSGLIDTVAGNTYYGYSSGLAATPDSSFSNTGVGTNALASNSEGSSNVAFGSGALRKDFTGGGNTAMGSLSLNSLVDGSLATAVGDGALQFSVSDFGSVATGSGALHFTTTGFSNTATGFNSMYSNLSGHENIAVGHHSLYSIIYPVWNVALGANAMFSNTGAATNVAIGANVLYADTIGGENEANGFEALRFDIAGNFNVADGNQALHNNTFGSANTALGNTALFRNSTGGSNIAVGFGTYAGNTTGGSNVAIGALTDVLGLGPNNNVSLGNGITNSTNNKVRIGNSLVTVIEGQVPFTTPSDGRFKYQVKEDVKGLDFILRLHPVTYFFDNKKFDEMMKGDKADKLVTQAAYRESSAVRRTGFIAQEVERAANAVGYDFSGIVRPGKEQRHYSLSYPSFVVPLVKGMQEQQRLIDAQTQKIAALRQTIKDNDALVEQLPELERQVNELRKLVRALQTGK